MIVNALKTADGCWSLPLSWFL